MDLDPLQVLLLVILLNVSIISADDFDFRRNLIRTRLKPSLLKKELRGSPSSEGNQESLLDLIDQSFYLQRPGEWRWRGGGSHWGGRPAWPPPCPPSSGPPSPPLPFLTIPWTTPSVLTWNHSLYKKQFILNLTSSKDVRLKLLT